uniref:G-protein coupled receptors family 1 profile domain-containing protein n=1 Tax=Glossina brevipalpis TaxID=37001 RepID=A0A1A9WR03_9MUSC
MKASQIQGLSFIVTSFIKTQTSVITNDLCIKFLLSLHSVSDYSFLNSCINPVTLYCISGTFRAHFNRYLCCRCTEHQLLHTRQHSTTTGIMNMSSLRHHSTSTSSCHKSTSVHMNRTKLNLSNGKQGEGEYNGNRAYNTQMR